MIPSQASGRASLALSLSALLAAGSAFVWRSLTRPEEPDAGRPAAERVQDPAIGPGLQPVDAFHPDRRPRADGSLPELPEPAYGGRVIVHLEAMPRSLNAVLQNSNVTRRVLYEVHETLLRRDPTTTEWRNDLAYSWNVLDRIVPKPGVSTATEDSFIGVIRDQGNRYLVDPKPGYASFDTPSIQKEDVLRVDRGSVLTFRLKPNVFWHDGHPLTARDIAFSWEVYGNPNVDCGEKRYRFQKFEKVQVIDFLTVRFVCGQQYFNAVETIGDMCILPSHLYDLADPDNEDGQRKRGQDPAWRPSPEEEARYIAENPHNRDWVGLGPYRVTKWTADSIEAERFDRYFDRSDAGYVDTIRWRAIPGGGAAFQALLAGELDFYPMMSAEDFFGEATQATSFTDRCYKGYFYTPAFWYVGWNLERPQLADVRVRRAIAMLFDFEGFRRSFYRGLAVQMTGPGNVYSDGYDRELEPYPRDPKRAAELLDEAGWVDRDGDGLREKDGVPLEIELLTQPANPVAQAFGPKLQEDLARGGIRLKLTALEFGVILERRERGEFDAVALGWAPPLESDPEQLWHSRWADRSKKSSNFVALRDEKVDELIDRGQLELDPAKRAAIWRELHRRLYELQPYLFCYNPPRKFAMSKAIRGFQAVPVDPNYVVRRWYYPAGTPGTRPTLERKGR